MEMSWMANDYHHLNLGREDAIATVTLARPDSRNALNPALISDLTTCFDDLAEDDSIRVVVLTGEGPSFCAGADIGYMRETARYSYRDNLKDARKLVAMYLAVDECPKPVVAKVRGAAIGGGAGLVAASDVVVAAEGTTFAFTEVLLGIAPATIAPFVARKIGVSRARTLFLSGERFDAGRAREIGLVHEVAAEGDLDAAVDAQVSGLLKGGPGAQAAIKALLRDIESVEMADAPGLMSRMNAMLRVSEEGQEGLGAFLEKREPSWRRGG